MNEQEKIEFFFEIFHATLPRLGPGDDASTKKALSALLSSGIRQGDDSPRSIKLRILDLGCGNGAQTIQLAKHTGGTILAVDNHQPYLDELRRWAEAEGVSDRIQPYLRDMRDLGLEKEAFDVIWSEGAIYIMGFRDGLVACHRLLAPRGALAATELSWLKPDPPDECRKFFSDEYPAMADVDTNLATIKACEYEVLGHFALPESAWWDGYYHPLEERLQSIREKYATDQEKLEVVESTQVEIEFYRKYSSYYGYVFYLMQRCA